MPETSFDILNAPFSLYRGQGNRVSSMILHQQYRCRAQENEEADDVRNRRQNY
jgi:hypothetical protein